MVISTNMTTTTTTNATTSTNNSNSNSSSVTPSAGSTTGTGSTSSSTTKLPPPPLKKRHYNETMNLKNQVAVDTETSLLPPAQHDEDAAAAQSVGHVPPPPPPLQPITADGIRPQKRFYRQRAHCNPLAHNDSYDYPITPFHMDWTKASNLYPVTMKDDRSKEQLSSLPPLPLPPSPPSSQRIPHQPTVLDIGCGFGGLTLALASIVPHENICGMEIRAKVTEYVRLRIVAARLEQTYSINPHAMETSIPPAPPPKTTTATNTTVSDVASPSFGKRHHYNNCGVIRTNSMKYLPNYFLPHTISKLFFCFPDPHFKRKNFPRRIVSYRLLDEYAYLLLRQRPKCDHDDTSTNENRGGMLYAITDVKELHEWHVQACQTHPLFEPVLMSESSTTNNNDKNDDDDDTDPFIHAMKYLTEEGQKVDRNHGSKYYIMYECRHWPDLTQPPTVHAGNFFQS